MVKIVLEILYGVFTVAVVVSGWRRDEKQLKASKIKK